MSACTDATFIQSFIQTSNEGIFIRSQKQQSFKISFQNPSQLQTTLDRDLALKLKNLGLKEVKENADYEILINLVDMKKHSYAQKITILKKQVFLQEQLILEIKNAVNYL